MKRHPSVYAFLGLGLLATWAAAASAGGAEPLLINEVMSANTSVHADPQGEFDDWVEIYNDSDQSVDLGGLYLTDNPDNPTQWRIPADTVVAPRGYRLIWADGDSGDSGLHADFKLDADGEELVLCAADGATVIDQVTLPALPGDTSYGRNPQAPGEWLFFAEPTPGAANAGAYEGLIAEVAVSREHGFCDEAFEVTLSCATPGVTILYTLNGDEPGRQISSRLMAGETYTQPIPVAGTTCLRAMARREGWRDARVVTRTYLFLQDVIRQSDRGQRPGTGWPAPNAGGGFFDIQAINYGMDPDVVDDPRYRDRMEEALLAIPAISLVTDLVHLFDEQKGIYVNALQDGRHWERPVSMELIHPDDTEGFQVNAGIRIRGGYGRLGSNPKHAFRLFFRSEYGVSRLEYPLFGDEGVDVFEKMDLRTAHNYSWSYKGEGDLDHGGKNTLIREVFSRDLQRQTDQPYTRSRYYHLYLNGQYWGLYQTQERSEARFAESYLGGDRDDYDVVKVNAGPGRPYTMEATDGNLEAYERLWLVAKGAFSSDEAYTRVQGLNPDGTPNPAYERLLDVDNLIAYMLCTFYVGDFDAPVSAFISNVRPNNFYAVYNRVDPDGFKFFRHDAEHSLFELYEDRTGPYPAGSQAEFFNPQWLHQRLLSHGAYRARLAEFIELHFFDDGIMTPAAVTRLFQARRDTIDLAIIAESARWGDAKVVTPRTRDEDWLPQITYLLDEYFPQRTEVVLNQFRLKGWYP